MEYEGKFNIGNVNKTDKTKKHSTASIKRTIGKQLPIIGFKLAWLIKPSMHLFRKIICNVITFMLYIQN